MTALEKLHQVLSPAVLGAGLIIPDLMVVPKAGATPEEILELEVDLPRPLLPTHRLLLSTWNGLNLDVIRILGVTSNPEGIPSILSVQNEVPPGNGNVAFATDPSGFLYFQSDDGQIWSLDHDGGEAGILSPSIDHFISEYVFGSEADQFLGEDWLTQLQELGLCSDGG